MPRTLRRTEVTSPPALILGAFAAALAAGAVALTTPWLPLDEIGVVVRARDLTQGPVRAGLLLPLLLWLPAHVLSASATIAIGKLVASFCWAATAVPAYVLARTVVRPRAAAAVAALTLAGPGAVYGATVLPDALALLLATSALALVAQGRRPELAVGLAVGAGLARPWLLPLAVALALVLWWPEVRRRAVRWPEAGLLALVPAVLYAVWVFSAPTSFGALVRGAIASPLLVAIAVGVVPWTLAWAAAAPPRLRTLLVATTAGVAVASAFAAAGAQDAAVDERPGLVLVPLVLTLAAVAFERGFDRGRLVRAAAVTVVATLFLPWPLPHAGGVVGAALARQLGSSHVLLVAIVALLAFAPRFRLREAVAVAATVIVAGGVAAWIDAAHTSSDLRALLPARRDAVDAAVGAGANVTWVRVPGQGDPRVAAEARLLNRSIHRVLRVDPAQADPVTGALDERRVDYALASRARLAGTPVARTAYGVVSRVDAAPSVAEVVGGEYTDGWSGGQTTYTRFAGAPRNAVLHVTISRAAWTGRDKPGKVSVDVSPLGGQPFSERVTTIHAGQTTFLDVPVPPPPFTAIVRIAPTFSPAEFGGTDTRQLGAILSFDYRG
jgi:hypothetical protein